MVRDKKARYVKKGYKDHDMRWDMVATLFHDRWIRYSTRDNLHVEFDTLDQGNLSVTEYRQKFERLVQYGRLYDREEKEKAKWFISWLRPEVSKYLVIQALPHIMR